MILLNILVLKMFMTSSLNEAEGSRSTIVFKGHKGISILNFYLSLFVY